MISDIAAALPLLPEHRNTEKRSQSLTLDDLLDEHRSFHHLSANTFDLVMMSYRYHFLADKELKSFLKKDLRPQKLLDLFRMLYAAVISRKEENESKILFFGGEYLKSINKPHLTGLLNAFLRNAQRNKKALHSKLEKDPSILLNPKLKKRWKGNDDLISYVAGKVARRPEAGIQAFNENLELSRFSIEDFQLQKLQAMNDRSWDYCLDCVATIKQETPAGSKVHLLDACAAPGGKLIAIHSLLKKDGFEAMSKGVELKYKRLERLQENISKWNLEESVSSELWDWTKDEEFPEANDIDYVFADLPCSGLGTLSTRPDLQLHLGEINFPELFELQKNILSSLLSNFKNTRHFFVSVCSVDPEEVDHISQLLEVAPFMSSSDKKGSEDLVAWKLRP